MKKLAYLFAFLSLTACDPLSGKLDVKQPFPARVNDGFLHWSTITIPKGTAEAKIEINGGGNAQITLGQGSSKRLIVMNIHDRNEIPQLEGTLDLLSAESRQPFDLHGVLHSNVTNSAPIRAVESCTVSRNIQVCDYYGCHWEQETYWGEQNVEYYIQTVVRRMSAKLTKVNQPSATYAVFGGSRSDSQKIYTRKSPCF